MGDVSPWRQDLPPDFSQPPPPGYDSTKTYDPWVILDVYRDNVVIDHLKLGGKECFMLGRMEGFVDVELLHPTMSRRHAIIARRRDGTIAIKDLQSAAGTWVDGQRIPGGAIADLKEGTKLEFAESSRVFMVRVPPPPPPSGQKRRSEEPPRNRRAKRPRWDNPDDDKKMWQEEPSAGQWAQADLGDPQRSAKFMSMMGAKGSSEAGHGERTHPARDARITQDLERQYHGGMARAMGPGGPTGLGLGSEPVTAESAEAAFRKRMAGKGSRSFRSQDALDEDL